MGKAFFPLDEQLALLPGPLAPRQQEHLVHLAAWMPFGRAAAMLQDLLAVRVSPQTVRRSTESMARCMQEAQDQQPTPDALATPAPAVQVARRVVSVDGAKISLRHQQWVEVRTLAIGVPEQRKNREGEGEIHVGQLSYFSRLADASTFTRTAQVEVARRAVGQAAGVCLVTDGAEWCQNFLRACRPDAVGVLDFPHAAQHVSDLLDALEQAGLPLPHDCLPRCLHLLKHRGPRALLRVVTKLDPAYTRRKGIAEHLEYLRKRQALMQYPTFQQEGWPIGSGMVESANKNVVQARLKGAGMHWSLEHVNPMLALRNAVCNERWQEMWQQARDRLHQLRKQRGGGKAPVVTAPSPSPGTRDGCSPVCAQAPHAPASPERFLAPQPRATTCPCGTPLLQKEMGAPRRYCSQACRQRAYEQRREKSASSAPAEQQPEATTESGAPRRRALGRTPTCPCGTPLPQKETGAPRRYCSQACRQRAYKQRWAACS